MGLCPTMAPSTPFVQRPSFDCRINQLPARKNWPCVRSFLGEFRGTLLTDGYEGYAAYAGTRPGQVIHGQCWSHTRRGFERAKDGEPEAVAEALALIGAMYRHEKQIRDDTLTGAAKHEYRTVHIRPVVEAFWKWCRTSCERTDLLPKNPLGLIPNG